MESKQLNFSNEEQKIREQFASRLEDVKILNNEVIPFTSSSLSNTSSSVSTSSSSVPMNSNEYSDLPLLPFHDENQQVILLNITHRNQRPRSKIPGFRVCGAFRSVDKLKEHVGRSGGIGSYGGANLLKAEAHKKFLICSSFEKQQNSTYVMNKIDEITKKYINTLQMHNEEFKKNKENHTQGKTGLSRLERIKKLTTRKELLDKKFDEESEKYARKEQQQQQQQQSQTPAAQTNQPYYDPDVFSRNAEVRKQEVAVISIIDDTTPAVINGLEDPEPVVIIWGCFENDQQAKHYIYNTASKYVTDVMLDVVNMYEWAYPSKIEDKIDEITEEFRNPTLDKVMKARKQQKAKVLSYEEWAKQENMNPSVLEILSDKKSEDAMEVETRIRKSECDPITMSVELKEEGAIEKQKVERVKYETPLETKRVQQPSVQQQQQQPSVQQQQPSVQQQQQQSSVQQQQQEPSIIEEGASIPQPSVQQQQPSVQQPSVQQQQPSVQQPSVQQPQPPVAALPAPIPKRSTRIKRSAKKTTKR